MVKEKQIYDITEEDIKNYPLWIFPMDDSVDDDFTIARPVIEESAVNLSLPMIIRTKFIDKRKMEYYGYIYWDTDEKIEFLKPVLYSGEFCITFWNGKENDTNELRDYMKEIEKEIGDNIFPFEFISEEIYGLRSIKGKLNGLYYLDDENIVQFIC